MRTKRKQKKGARKEKEKLPNPQDIMKTGNRRGGQRKTGRRWKQEKREVGGDWRVTRWLKIWRKNYIPLLSMIFFCKRSPLCFLGQRQSKGMEKPQRSASPANRQSVIDCRNRNQKKINTIQKLYSTTTECKTLKIYLTQNKHHEYIWCSLCGICTGGKIIDVKWQLNRFWWSRLKGTILCREYWGWNVSIMELILFYRQDNNNAMDVWCLFIRPMNRS